MTEAYTKMDGVARFASGYIDPSATGAKAISLGFRPRYVLMINEDLVVRWEKLDSMAAAACLKTVTGGTMTYDANSAIVIDDAGFTISSAAYGDGDNVMWAAWG